MTVYLTAYRSPAEETMVVDISSLLLHVERDPVVETNDLFTFDLANKHLLKAGRIEVPNEEEL